MPPRPLLWAACCLAALPPASSASLLRPTEVAAPGSPTASGAASEPVFGRAPDAPREAVLQALQQGAVAPPGAAPHSYRRGLKLGLAVLSTALLLVTGWEAVSFSLELGMIPLSKRKAKAADERSPRSPGPADGGTAVDGAPVRRPSTVEIDSPLRERLERGELDQAWDEELGLCATQLGRKRWYLKSEVDPSNYHADLAKEHPADDVNGWPGRGEIERGEADADRSREERRIVTLHSKLLERERFVSVDFWKLLRKDKWADAPGGYPGPAFETKAEFTRGTRPRRWPLGLEGTEDTSVCDLKGPQLADHLRGFIWRNNSEGSLKASLIMIFLGVFPNVQHYLFGKIVETITPHAVGVFVSLDASATLWIDTRFVWLVIGVCAIEVVSHYVSFKFWTTVPKYGVLRQFQSFFGRRCLQILMTQASPRNNRLSCAHEDRFRDSPRLCQAMVNYCCEAVVLNLWGKWFDHTRAKSTLITSLLLIVYAMTFETGAGATTRSTPSNFVQHFWSYGCYLFLFMTLSCATFSLNVLYRVQNSVDTWGAATKAKLNMFSLQQELTHRMMSAGSRRRGAPPTVSDRRLLDEASSDWHDACRIYGNRDFHTWFSTWIVTDEFNNMLNSLSLMMCTVVLGLEVIGGHMTVGTFVMVVATVRSINGAFSSLLGYYFSMPEGYVALLYLAQVCNMSVPEDEEGDDEEGDDDEQEAPSDEDVWSRAKTRRTSEDMHVGVRSQGVGRLGLARHI